MIRGPRSRVLRGRRPGAPPPPAVLLLFGAMLLGVACGAEVPAEWTLDFELLLELGGPGSPPEQAFYQPTGIGVDGGGRVHVLDAGNSRIQIFDPSGAFLRSLGRPGAGPGELARPEDLWVFPDGEVVVADSGNVRLTRFGPAGDPLPGVVLDFLPLAVVGTRDRLWILRLPPAALVAGSDPAPLVHEFDRDGRPLGSAVTPYEADIGLIYFIQNTLRMAAAPDDGFALADTHVRSRIRQYASDGSERPAIPVLYKAQGWAPLRELPRRLEDAGLARIARTATDLAWDSKRRLYWVLSGYVDRDPDGTWVTGRELYRYDAGGEYRGSVVLPFAALRVAPSADGSIWLLDAEGVVHRARILDPEAGP